MRLSSLVPLFVFACVLFIPGIASAAIVTIDGTPVSGVVVHDGHILVPFRVPMEQLGATVVWSDSDQTGTATASGHELIHTVIGSTTAFISGYPKVLDVAPVLIEHIEYVPVEMLPEISSAHLVVAPDASTATITDFDLAGVNAVGSSAASMDPEGKILYLWVWLLPISALVCGAAYVVVSGQVMRRQRSIL